MTRLTPTEIYLKLPWTIQPSISEDTGARQLRVAELPEFLVVEVPGQSLERDFWDALRGLIASYAESGDPLPLPRGADVQKIVARMLPDPVLECVPVGAGQVTTTGSSYEERSLQIA